MAMSQCRAPATARSACLVPPCGRAWPRDGRCRGRRSRCRRRRCRRVVPVPDARAHAALAGHFRPGPIGQDVEVARPDEAGILGGVGRAPAPFMVDLALVVVFFRSAPPAPASPCERFGGQLGRVLRRVARVERVLRNRIWSLLSGFAGSACSSDFSEMESTTILTGGLPNSMQQRNQQQMEGETAGVPYQLGPEPVHEPFRRRIS